MTDPSSPDLPLRGATPETEAGDATPPPRPPARSRWPLLIGLGVFGMALGMWLVASRLPGFLTRSETPPPAAARTDPNTADVRRIAATLFYVSADGLRLTPVARDVLYGATPAEQARRIVEAQVATPEGQLSAIPAGTTVRSVFLTDEHEAYVDLGGSIVEGQTGGSLDEALAVYAIVNAITTNLPEVVAVQILIDGKEVDTLAGHLDLRFPLGKAPDWIEKGPETR